VKPGDLVTIVGEGHYAQHKTTIALNMRTNGIEAVRIGTLGMVVEVDAEFLSAIVLIRSTLYAIGNHYLAPATNPNVFRRNTSTNQG